MAEFKLGRIRFIWKGDWSDITVYYKDDIVRNGGNTYVCVAGHTSSAEFPIDSIKWNKISDGQVWKDSWLPATYYNQNDIVKNGGYLYIANTAHTSAATEILGLEDAQHVAITGVSIDGIAGQFSCDDTVLDIDSAIIVSGTTFSSGSIVGYVNPKTYYVIATNGVNTFTLSATKGGPAVVTTASTGAVTGITFTTSYWDIFTEGFNYTGDWGIGQRYKINDIAKYGSSVYICTVQHTSAATFALGLESEQNVELENVVITSIAGQFSCDATILDIDAAIIVSGTTFSTGSIVGYTNPKTYYIIETNGTTTFTLSATKGGPAVVTTASTGAVTGITFKNSKWNLFADGLTWNDVWNPDTRYKRNDVVRYGGTLYICVEGHTSAATEALGLEDDQAKWEYAHKGIEYLGNWQGSTPGPAVRYKINDVVKYGGGLWICVTPHTSQTYLTDDESKWEQFVEGLEFEDSWLNTTRYQPGDFVTYGGYSYVAKSNNLNAKPTASPSDWDLFTTGFRFVEDWSNTVDYLVGDVIRISGYTYLCMLDHIGQRPPNTLYWQRLNSGFVWQDAWTNGDIYNIGDAVRYNDNSYLCIANHTADQVTLQNRPDQDVTGLAWNIISGGAESGNMTTQGDLVYYGGAGPTRLPIGEPGQILKVNTLGNAPEWQFFGAINNVFYISGDRGVDSPAPGYGVTLDRPWATIRYAAEQVEAGAIRYNAKTLLQLNRSFIQAEVVNYVTWNIANPTGIWVGFTNDDPVKCARDIGQIIDAIVWDISHGGNVRTREAALTYFSGGNITATGATYTPTTGLLTITSNAHGLSVGNTVRLAQGSLTFTCASDGNTVPYSYPRPSDPANGQNLLVSGVTLNTFTINVGVSSETSAHTFVSATANGITKSGTALIAAIADEDDQLVASINYMVTVADAVLSNLAPAVNYQTLNAVGSPITQVVDISYTEETDAQALVASLASIISTAVTAGVSTGIPTARIGNTTLFVKTGTFEEVLPIIIPAETAIVGDELRSTRIVAAGSFVNLTDVPYSLSALARLKAVIGLAITAPGSIVKTTGNALNPVTTRPVGSAGAGTAAQALIQNIDDYIDFKINANGSAPAMTGTITPNTTTEYTYALDSLEANRAFLKAEIIAYIALTFSGYTYDTAACARDVDRYIDAVKHDLIYTGNYRSLLAARYYVNAVNGSTLEDMFYVRNGTGLRNCTLAGLNGVLGSPNSYGTRRPTAGAYVSLDPGWGHGDQRAWITTRSPYVQNVTTFGTGCVGQKVDGSLHAGGNDSIVSNDFTQVLSDGIGAWVTNLARAELVSVFSYYGHIGYLAENGGKIRATNGNSSYGDFGCVAEGVDATETAITATVDNRTFDAIVANVFTSGSQVYVLEYLNAGVGYTTSTTAILTISNLSFANGLRTQGTYLGITGTSSGPGTGQEFIINIDDAGLPAVTIVKGGTGHVATNVITIAAALIGGTGPDVTFTIATVGKATQFSVTGEGFGAVVNNAVVGNGSVYEVRLLNPADNFGGLDYVTATNVAAEGTSTQIVISNTDNALDAAYVGMAIFITSGKGVGQYGYINSYNSGTKTAQIRKVSDDTAGWDHLVSGTAIQATLDETTTYVIEPRLTFSAPPSGTRAFGRARVEDGKIVQIRIIEPGTGYVSAPTMTVTDPNNTVEVPHQVRIGDGVLRQPTWTNRGTGFVTSQVEITGDGYADLYQPGRYVQVAGLTEVPQAGANVTFSGIPGDYYKLVSVTQLLGNGPYSARLQVSPDITITHAPTHGDAVELRIRYSQVRLTGHDFLDIGTGNFANTNYPGIPLIAPDPLDETVDAGGGRVFYTSTDQDGNFRVGELFSIEQATGVATLNADAFNISGLQELQLGAVSLGGTSAVITEFSTDGTFTANSDNIVPTQKAIKTYIASQIGGGAGELNVNSITAGYVLISTNEITTTDLRQINILQKVNFVAGVDGQPLALNYYLLS